MIDIHIKQFDQNSIQKFWKKVLEHTESMSDLDIYLSHESADIVAIDPVNKEILVKFFALDDCLEWSNLADSDISENEYKKIIDKKVETIFSLLKQSEPNNLGTVNYSSTWLDDYSYMPILLRAVKESE